MQNLQPQLLYKQTKALVVSPTWQAFDELLEHWINLELGALCQATDLGVIRETQGKIKALRTVRALPEDIRRRENDERRSK